MYNKKKTYLEISKSLGRKKGAIISRLYMEKLIDDDEYLKHYSLIHLNKLKNQKKFNIDLDIDESILLDI